uniref:Uncharacterized protein n=1 Tax=Strongyloides stercoralis TaxID=6248 RepID=A0AAF5DGC5_STRER
MTATEQMAAVLNELMGTRRNADIGTNISARFDDPEICNRLKEDMAKKIAKNKERLAITQSKDETKKYEQRSDIEKKISKIKAEIEENQKQVESYGLQGEIEKAAEITTIVERLVEEKKGLEKRIEAMLAPTDEMGNKQKQMEVCEICSCFLVVGDAETRMEEHFQDVAEIITRIITKDTTEDMEENVVNMITRGMIVTPEDVVVQEATHVTNK